MLFFLLVAFAAGGTVDLILDKPTHWLSFHTIYEVGLSLCAGASAVWLWNGWRRAVVRENTLRQTLAERQAERDAWRAGAERALVGFAQAVDAQFVVWRLTPAERDVALELLKGKSHKQIAAQTGRSERTVRQHAVSAYEKAGVDGRAELAGFFLEGLQLPAGPSAIGTDLSPVRERAGDKTSSDMPVSGL